MIEELDLVSKSFPILITQKEEAPKLF